MAMNDDKNNLTTFIVACSALALALIGALLSFLVPAKSIAGKATSASAVDTSVYSAEYRINGDGFALISFTNNDPAGSLIGVTAFLKDNRDLLEDDEILSGATLDYYVTCNGKVIDMRSVPVNSLSLFLPRNGDKAVGNSFFFDGEKAAKGDEIRILFTLNDPSGEYEISFYGAPGRNTPIYVPVRYTQSRPYLLHFAILIIVFGFMCIMTMPLKEKTQDNDKRAIRAYVPKDDTSGRDMTDEEDQQD